MSPTKELLGVEKVRTAGDKIVHLELANGAVCTVSHVRRLRELARACRRVLEATTEGRQPR